MESAPPNILTNTIGNEVKKDYFIPIIGQISSGKSTFLKAFLGIEELETGVNTTTKFVLLIKNNPQISFYHVNLKREGDEIIVEKDENKLTGLNTIKQKIIDLNEEFSQKNINKDKLFYMFETPIKNIDNKELLDHCIFMDIPGLNEYESNNIDEIFSIINLKNILFEIFIFDSSSFQSDANLNIFKELEEKKSLKKKGNLIILNKIDTLSLDGNNNVESVIQKFRDSFYQNYEKNKNDVETENCNLIESEKHIEDEKNNNINIKINLYDNTFIPMNSILYNAEKKYEKDFLSWLIIQLYSWI